jgi:hypothetical protein
MNESIKQHYAKFTDEQADALDAMNKAFVAETEIGKIVRLAELSLGTVHSFTIQLRKKLDEAHKEFEKTQKAVEDSGAIDILAGIVSMESDTYKLSIPMTIKMVPPDFDGTLPPEPMSGRDGLSPEVLELFRQGDEAVANIKQAMSMLKKPLRVLCKRTETNGDTTWLDESVDPPVERPRDNRMFIEGHWYDVVFNEHDVWTDKDKTFSVIDNQGHRHLHYMYTEEDKKAPIFQPDGYGPRDYAKWFYTPEELKELGIPGAGLPQ